MNYHPRDTYCVDETLTPRVRTIFLARHVPAPVPPTPETPAGAGEQKKELGWHDLICEILESLFPFPDAYKVVRQTLDAFGEKLPSPT